MAGLDPAIHAFDPRHGCDSWIAGSSPAMTAGLAMIVIATFFLAIHLDLPFSGPVHITPEAVVDVIQRMKTEGPVADA
ncbi:hypothetical protein [Methyloceanibacter sp.]|uniref:hypothetical protein n=1 Tax=Methyloceanibacter sp. TaxID=1965321 RepID=UPI002CCAE29D|nr:hypothetical protein [Methyloceanibacter sp.]HML92445.1 hypothetical protein [Methyloceanibacter sp.]